MSLFSPKKWLSKMAKMYETIRFFDKKCILVSVFRKQIQNLLEVKKMVRCHWFFIENPFRGGKIAHKSRFWKITKSLYKSPKMVQMT